MPVTATIIYLLAGGWRSATVRDVRSRTVKLCVLILLVISVGGQWALLQSIAWMGMLVDYSRQGSVTQAVCKTFDGKHPCCLCKAIAAGKKSEQKKEVSPTSQKLEFPPIGQELDLVRPSHFPLFRRVRLVAKSAFQKPPTPPPRRLLALA